MEKNLKFIDTHAHLYLAEFDVDRDEMIQRAISSNVNKIILPNIDLKSLQGLQGLAFDYPDICYPTIGLHPCDVKEDYKSILTEMENLLQDSDFIAIGETGTDAYWDTSYWNQQVDSFTIQIEWAKANQLPVIIHSRETLSENIEIIKKHQNGSLKGIFHCFNGTLDQAKEIQSLGFLLGIGGVLTYKNCDLKNFLSEIGLNPIVLETDAPFLTPVPYRGKRNESSYIPLIAQKLSDILQIPLIEIAHSTYQNAISMFQIEEID